MLCNQDQLKSFISNLHGPRWLQDDLICIEQAESEIVSISRMRKQAIFALPKLRGRLPSS
jgi:hypothetical protein